MHSRSRYYEPVVRFNRLQSESRMFNNRPEKEYYLSPQPSIDADKLRYRLETPLDSKKTSITHNFRREASRRFIHRLQPIDREIGELQQELEYKRSLRNHLENSRKKLESRPLFQTHEEEDSRLVRRRTTENSYFNEKQPSQKEMQAVWQNPDIFRSTRKKTKIYKIKPKKQQLLQPLFRDISEYVPVIDKIKLGRSSRRDKQYLYQIMPSPIGKIYTRRRYDYSHNYRYDACWKRLRKVAHAVLFTIYLRRFDQRIRRNRQGHTQTFMKQEVKDKLLNLKNFIIQHSQPFFLALISQNTIDYSLEKEDPQLKKEKQRHLKQLIEMELSCMQKCIRRMVSRQFFSQLLYYICRHGNFACCYQMFTDEQLSLLCISQKHGYVSADKNLQQSALLSIVFMKILLFNILLQPSKIQIFADYRGSTQIIFKNIRLIATILYELFIDVQDNLLEKADGVYTIGNWKKTRFQMKSAQSMTVKAGFYQKNQLISGLADHKYIKEVYGTRFMVQYKNLIEQLVKVLHSNMVNFHTRIIRRYF